MSRRLIILALTLILGLVLVASACGGTKAPETTGPPGTTAPAASGEPFIFGYNEGFTGFMAYDCSLAEKGIYTALSMLDNQVLGRPLKYVKADNASDPVIAVDKARQLVESDKVQMMMGIFSPAVAAVTDFLGKAGGIPDITIVGQPSDNLKTANGLAFMPNGIYGSHGYYFGKYVIETLGYKSVNCIHFDDTAAHELQAGFERAFSEGGGQILSVNYVPLEAVDFSAYLTSMKPADATLFWIFGNGAVPFVKQYADYGLKAPLLVPMANNFSREQLAELGDLGLGMVACDFYADSIDYPANKEFVEVYQKLYPGEYPMPQGYGAWQAVIMFAKAIEATGGDTTPAKLIEAMSNMTFDTPSGKVTISPYKDAFIGTRNFFILKTEKVDGEVIWMPLYTFEQVLLGE